MSRFLCRFSLSVLALVAASEVRAQSSPAAANDGLAQEGPVIIKEKDHRAPVDFGPGPSIRPSPAAKTMSSLAVTGTAALAAGVIPAGGKTAGTKGVFGLPITWPIIGLHAILLPDGRVMTYGTDELGQQTGQIVYDVWDPASGTGSGSHNTLPNTTGTDLFCSAQSILSNGQVLITGGDRTINGVRNYSTEQTNIFDPSTSTLRPNGAMSYARWYPTIVSMPNGDAVILGGRQDFDVDAPTPEVFNPATGWRVLSGASSVPAYGFPDGNWYYPRAFVTSSRKIFVLGNWTRTYLVDPAGSGSVLETAADVPPGDYQLPSVMYAPGKILSLRAGKKVVLINTATTTPKVTSSADIDQVRYWANTTVLPDGRVFVNGGSTVANELTGVAYTSQIWNPSTGKWTTGAAAAKPRLYHSIALLLPDGSVLTGAGGAPGPVNNLNMEIYYPSYLYQKDGSGLPAARPSITAAPEVLRLGQTFTLSVDSTAAISRVTMVRTGSVTHAFNPDQRLIGLSYTQSSKQLQMTLPKNSGNMLPGYYMIFVFRNGVPSIAKIIKVEL